MIWMPKKLPLYRDLIAILLIVTLLSFEPAIAQECENQSPLKGVIEVDESYFGAKRIKGKRGRGAFKKTPVFGIFKRGGKVYTEIVPDCAKDTLKGIIRGTR